MLRTRNMVLFQLLMLMIGTDVIKAQDVENDIACVFDPDDPLGEGVDPTSQNTIDKMIQKIQGTPFGGLIRKIIRRNILKPDSLIRRMLGKVLQDPHDENFEEGEVGITQPVYGPLLGFITKLFGETKTVVGYLREFGFFAKVLGMSPNAMDNYQGSIPPCAITQAVKEFQIFNNLEPTGVLTKETRDLMKEERCGNPDVECETPECIAEKEAEKETNYLDRKRRALSRKKRYSVVRGRKWKQSEFKYFFQKYTEDLPVDVQRAEIERGLREWSMVADLSFTEVDNEAEADMKISFGGGDHGDSHPFYGPGGVLAHGFYPRNGDMHFDDDEMFTSNTPAGTNLYYIATHEFGHVLGIRHTNIRGAVMFPYYPQGFTGEIDMAADDVAAVRKLFGAGQGAVTPLQGGAQNSGEGAGGTDKDTTSGNVDNIELEDNEDNEDNADKGTVDNIELEEPCLSEINAAFNHPTEKYAYVVSRDKYFRLEANERNLPVVSDGYPQSVAEQWHGLNGDLDAAFTDYKNGKTYFFVKGKPRRKVYCWNWNKGEMEMSGEDEENTIFAKLPPGDIKGIASYHHYVLFLFENEYYLWTPKTGLYEEPQTWPYQSGEKSVSVSGAFDAFLRGYFYTGSQLTPERYFLFRSKEFTGSNGKAGMVEKYSYRRFDDDMRLPICV